MTKRVLIIGGSGFVGKYVARHLLERGDYVVNLDLKEPSLKSKFLLGDLYENVVFIRGSCAYFSELISIIQSHTIDSIIHLAAIQNQAYANKHPLPVYDLHVNGVLNILEASRLLSVSKVVVGSSTAVNRVIVKSPHGTTAPGEFELMDEGHPIHSISTGHLTGHYGASKAAAEIIAMSYLTTNELDVVIARMTHIYGFGMWSDAYIRTAVENIVNGHPTHYKTGADSLFDYTYVEDVAAGILKCLDVKSSQLKQRVFLIANGNLRSAVDAVRILQKLAPNIETSIGEGRTEQKEGSFRTTLDVSNATEQLGYTPRYDLESGLSKFIDIQRQYEVWRTGM